MCPIPARIRQLAGIGGPAIGTGALLVACTVPAPTADRPVTELQILPFAVEGPIDQPDFVGRAIADSLVQNLDGVPGLRVLPASAPVENGTATLTGRFRRAPGEHCLEVRARIPGRDEPLWSVARCSGFPSIPDLIHDVANGCVEALGRERPARYPYIGRVPGGRAMAASPLFATVREQFRQGDYDGLATTGRALVEQFPTDSDAHVVRAWALTLVWDASPTAENLSALRDALDGLTRVDPESPYDEMLQGYVYRNSGAPDEARQLYVRILERHDLTPAARSWVFRQRSFTWVQAGQGDAARRDAEEAVRLDPADPLALVALSKALELAGQLDAALARAAEAVALEPDSWRHLQRVGIAAMRAGSYDLAAHYLDRACENGGTQEACANLAVLLQRAGRRDEALEVATRAATLPESPWGAYNLACLWAQRGDRSAALAGLRRAFELGFADALIATDPDLSGLRGNRAFDAEVENVLGRIRARRRIATTVFPWQG